MQRIPLRAVLFLALVSYAFLGKPVSLRAQEPAPLTSGTECQDPPQFSFSWIDTDVVSFIVTGKQDKPIIATIEYLCDDSADCGDGAASATSIVTDISADADKESERMNCWTPDSVRAKLTRTPSTRASERKGPLKLCVQPSEEGTKIPLCLDRDAILRAGGYVAVTYATTADTIPDTCKKKLAGTVPVKAMEKHRISFDVGSVFTLAGDGGFDTNAEAAVSARSLWATWFEGAVALRYSAIGQIAKAPDPASETTKSAMGKATKAEEEEPFNPFTAGGGVFEANVYGVVKPIPSLSWAGLSFGAGFTTVPGEEGSALETRDRWFVGLRTSVQGFNAGDPANRLGNSTGYVQAGYLKDRLFEDVILDPENPTKKSDESARWFLAGEIELPRVGTDWARITLRAVANLPKSGDGPSDVRISALVSIDPRSWFPGLKGKGQDLQQ